MKEVVRSACRTALLEAGFTPDDYYYDGADSPGMYGEWEREECSGFKEMVNTRTYTLLLACSHRVASGMTAKFCYKHAHLKVITSGNLFPAYYVNNTGFILLLEMRARKDNPGELHCLKGCRQESYLNISNMN